MDQQHPSRPPSQAIQARETNGGPSLLALLGFTKVAAHINELRLFYLIGCAYHEGARSLRQIARVLRTPSGGPAERDPRTRAMGGLPKSLRAIHEAVAVLEGLLGEQLVNRTGEGLGYNGLTAAGERLWELTVEFLQELWA